jgi:DNA-binding GntR family transcriptional regulator
MDTTLEPTLSVGATPSLPEIVYRELRKAILNGMFAPGQMLRQEDVAARLGVSRSPLREALPRLEAEGIVVLHHRRGYAVAILAANEIAEVFDLRRLLEGELALRSISLRTEADVARVSAIVKEMAVLAAEGDAASRSHWFELNMQFHQALLAPAQCPHHMRALELSRGLIESYIRTEVQVTGDLRQAQQEHAELSQAFAAGNADAFIKLTRTHSEHTRDRLLAGLAAKNHTVE